MGPKDRDYFILRAEQERDAASHSSGEVRGRHEELAWLYQMRIIYIDRGMFTDGSEETAEAPPIQRVIITA
ncbi:MAG TPA: hypothetical protein VE820_05880 [Sphingomicrobium sp.]|jgi:hypothetical protein|nr:hypothetical protein [Sphingomicrobium sp.]